MPDPNESLVVARFFMHTTQNAAKSKVAGRPIFDEIEACEVRMAANKQTRGVFPAHEVFKWTTNAESGEKEPLTYAMAYSTQYLAFKSGVAQTQSGTPLSELPFLTASKRLELKALSIHTAEALAALDGRPLQQLGMGGRELKNQAQAYIDNAAGSADVTRLAADNVALTGQVADMQRQLKELQEGLAAKDKKAPPPEPTIWDTYDDDDIKNWIAEQTGAKPKGKPSRETLIATANEINAEIAAKNKAAA